MGTVITIILILFIVIAGLLYCINAYGKTISDYYSEDDVMPKPLKEETKKVKTEKIRTKNDAQNLAKSILKARLQGHCFAVFHGERYKTGLSPIPQTGLNNFSRRNYSK